MSELAKRDRHSYSSLDTFEQCPFKFRCRYAAKIPKTHIGHNAAGVGTACHNVCEHTVKAFVEAGKPGSLPIEMIPDLLRKEWVAAEIPGDSEEFTDALSFMRRWAGREGHMDPRDVVSTEDTFSIRLGTAEVTGKIDRVDAIDRGAGAFNIIDYKTNRVLYQRWEVESNLQLSIYGLAAVEMWGADPDKCLFSYNMLRHGVTQIARRSAQQLEATSLYVQALVDFIDRATDRDDFPCKVNVYCTWCEYRGACSGFASLEADALAIGGGVHEFDLVGAARERDRWHAVEKAAKNKKVEAEKVIKKWMKEHGEVQAAGMAFRFYDLRTVTYDTAQTLAAIAESTGLSPLDVAGKVCKINAKQLEEWIQTLDLDRGDQLVLGEDLEALADVNISPRFSSARARKA